MEKPRYTNCEDNINNDLSEQMRRIYPNTEVSVKINYAAFFPDFHPQKYIAGEAVENPENTKSESNSQEGQNEFDYERLKEEGIFIRDGKSRDSAGVLNTTNTFIEKN